MNDPDIATWGEDGERLDRDREIDSLDVPDEPNPKLVEAADRLVALDLDPTPDHYRTVWFGVAGAPPEFVSKPACGCGNVYASENALNNHLRRELNP